MARLVSHGWVCLSAVVRVYIGTHVLVDLASICERWIIFGKQLVMERWIIFWGKKMETEKGKLTMVRIREWN